MLRLDIYPFPLFHLEFWNVLLGVDLWCWGLQTVNTLG